MTRPSLLTVSHLISSLVGFHPPELEATRAEIRRVVIDSRLVTPESLFVALRGERQDGHDFLLEAIQRGATAVMAERLPGVEPSDWLYRTDGLQICRAAGCFCLVVPDSLAALQRAAAFWRRQHDVGVTAVTGSVGKTNCKEAIAAVLRQRYHTLKSEGNYNNEIGLPLTLLHLLSSHQRVVLEMGMYSLGEIAQLASIALPQLGVVTNVGPSHLERLGSLERIAEAKSELPRALPTAEDGGVAILNADDERVLAMAGLTRARVVTYGLTPTADVWADEVESEGLEGIRLRFRHRSGAAHARLPMLGRHSVHTALAAAAVGMVEGMDWSEIIAGLRDQSAQLRLVAVRGPRGAILLDDTYNASPASCISALNLLGELNGRKVAVLGDMYELGELEVEGHRLVGRRARDVADILITVGRLGRLMAREALDSGMDPGSVHLVDRVADAVALLSGLIEPSDTVLVKGSRAMSMEQIVSALAEPQPGRATGGEESA